MQAVARAAHSAPDRLGPLILVVTRALGAPNGIIAGQAWKCEAKVSLAQYHQAKTGALFAAATAAGACAAGHEASAWHPSERSTAWDQSSDMRDAKKAHHGIAAQAIKRI